MAVVCVDVEYADVVCVDVEYADVVCVGVEDGPSGSRGDAAGMMILAGGGRGVPLDYSELERRTRVGYERGMRSRKGER